MALAVELYFDEATERRVDALRRQVYEAGIEPSGSVAGSRPHISLSVVETEDTETLVTAIEQFAGLASCCPVRLAAVASFPTHQGVLYLAPVPTVALLELHSAFHRRLRDLGLESRPFYRPGAWMPHCTIEMELTAAQLATAFDVAWRNFEPWEGKLVEAGVVSFPPVSCLKRVPLRANDPEED